MSGVFISYRREDSGGYAGRLFDILSTHFGEENVFMDLNDIKGGDNFETVIEDQVGRCGVLLAVIGERWLTITGEDGVRRLEGAGDFVRLEISKALQRGVRVIPVLVGNAAMPHASDLPEDLQPLSLHQAMDLRDAHFREDADRLVVVLSKIDPTIRKRPWKVTPGRFAPAILAVVVAAVADGVFLFRHAKPAAQAEPIGAHQNQVGAASGPVSVAQASPLPNLTRPVKGAVTQAGDPAKSDQPNKPAQTAMNIAGEWKATVTYDWPGAVYPETFDFEVDRTELSGTASLFEAGRGIFDGKIEGNRVSFTTKSTTEMGDKTYQDKHLYKGLVAGDTIQFSMLTDSESESHVPIHFTAKRVGK